MSAGGGVGNLVGVVEDEEEVAHGRADNRR